MKTLALDKYYESPFKRRRDFLPAGQTTQMVIGASPENDAHILKLTERLYSIYKLKRVYYSSYIPTNFDTSLLPYTPAPKIREHRLYQADWLLRFYGFTADEITENNGNLALEYDPKCAWAIRHLELFPVEINSAPLDMLLRVPGIGVRTASRILIARKHAKLDFDALKRLRVVLKRAAHFITCGGKFIGCKNENDISRLLVNGETVSARQLSMFDTADAALSALNGEL